MIVEQNENVDFYALTPTRMPSDKIRDLSFDKKVMTFIFECIKINLKF